MFGVVAHDLRSPLNGILAASQLLRRSHPELEPVEWITHATDRMNRLIHDLLDVARLEASAFGVRPGRNPVGPIVEEAVANARAAGPARQIVVDVEAGLPQV